MPPAFAGGCVRVGCGIEGWMSVGGEGEQLRTDEALNIGWAVL